MFDFSNEKKEKYFEKAEKILVAAGFEKIKVDRARITVKGNDEIKVYTVPWNKSILSRDKLKELKALPEFHITHDRYTKGTPGKQIIPRVYEEGYLILNMDEEDR